MSGSPDDTIVAPATPVGRGALAIVRLDGPGSSRILTAMSGSAPPPVRHAALTELMHKGIVIDQCIVVRYEAPHSFTGNDLIEFTLHGNPLLVSTLLSAAVDLGARIAEPGEFTERAVLNGKIDLVQAESIADLIDARTALQARLSLANLGGRLSEQAAALRQMLLDVIARLEAALDFSDEGYEFIAREEVMSDIGQAIAEVTGLSETYRRGRATTAGLSAVILGRPNAGKSTLLNRLVGTERAIVTPIAGTTRDIVTETIEIGGLPVTLADTAGLRESSDAIEEIGVARAREAAARADLILYLIAVDEGMTEEDRSAIGGLTEQEVVVLYTKTDLQPAPAETIGISVKSGMGMGELLARLDALVRERFAAPEGSPAIVNERQRAALDECRSALAAALASAEEHREEQIILVDLYRASTALGLLTGAITADEVFGEIFARFCIGK
ncbi:MAG TPA: tRNA uridine-5-carboxymethylaminomethyl(34) synthesis GTPase MnmE [Thermoanaerobaculia bacterium]|nr:tRNA uridine-5-carboxymethylaminomethyl(34) synthesis GTPase MnmE [Thermoanaerobaculia bacterium]